MDTTVGSPVPKRAGRLIWFQAAGAVVTSMGAFLVLCLCVIIPSMRASLIDGKREAIADHTSVAVAILAESYAKERAGKATREEAQRDALRVLRGLRYGVDGKDYFWVNNLEPRVLMHPYRTDLEGQYVGDFVDPAGCYVFREAADTARRSGQGFMEYHWQWMDDPQQIRPKVSHVRWFEPWGWVVGTGVYLTDVDRQASALMRRTVEASVVVGCVLLLLSGHLALLATGRERKRTEMEAALVQSERRLGEIVASIPDAVVVSDANRRVVTWNRAAEEMTGVAATEIIGQPIERVAVALYGEPRRLLLDVACGDPMDEIGEWAHVRQEGDRVEGYARCTGLPNGPRWLYAAACPLRGTDGEITGAIETLRDVTAWREVERERNELQHQLDRAQKMDVMGRLAGGVAHDFNNLLCPILGWAELIALDPEASTVCRESAARIAATAERAAELTRKLLAFGRQQAFERVPLDLNQVVSGFEPIMRSALREDTELSIVQDQGLWPIRGNAGQLEQVLMNLIVNARDAMPGGGTVRVTTSNRTIGAEDPMIGQRIEPGSYVCLSVEDTGIGMDAQTLERAFEPFFSTKPSGQGTGLGLASVYGIVREHGGRVWVYSEPGHGTTFRILLPRTTPAETVGPGTELSAVSLTGHETVLVVEDEDTVRELVTQVLAMYGYTVLPASNGVEALDLLQRGNHVADLVLTDVVMPLMSGRQLRDRLAEAQPDLRVVFMSGYAADLTDAAMAGPGGRHRLLLKPFSTTELLRAVRQSLDE